MRRRNKPGGIYVQAPKKRRSLLKALLGAVLLLAIVGAIANAASKNQAAVPQGAAPVVAAATSQPAPPTLPSPASATPTPRKPSHFSVVASVDPAAVPVGGEATLYLHTRIGSTCTATARYDGGAAAKLSKKPVPIGHTGIAPWVWKVRTGAAGGTATGICHWKGQTRTGGARFGVVQPTATIPAPSSTPISTAVPTVPRKANASPTALLAATRVPLAIPEALNDPSAPTLTRTCDASSDRPDGAAAPFTLCAAISSEQDARYLEGDGPAGMSCTGTAHYAEGSQITFNAPNDQPSTAGTLGHVTWEWRVGAYPGLPNPVSGVLDCTYNGQEEWRFVAASV